MKQRKLHFSAGFLLLIAWMVYLDTESIVPMSLLACALHEMGHILAVRYLGNTIKEISITVLGAELKTEQLLDYRSEGIVALCGPGMNLFLAALFSIPEWGHVFSGINLVLGSLNLLPVLPLDGGRILRAVLSILTDNCIAEQITRCLGVVLCLFLCLCGGWVAVYAGNITLLLVSTWMISPYFKRKVYD